MPRHVGDHARYLARHVEPGGHAEAERVRPLRDRVGAEPRARLVEEHVAARAERVLEVHRAVARLLVAAPHVRAHPEVAGAEDRLAWPVDALLERCDRGERLEGRARVVVLLHRAEQLGLERVGVDRGELRAADAARHLVRIGRGPVHEREDEPGLRVHGEDAAGGRREGLLDELLEAPVEREDEVLSRGRGDDAQRRRDELVGVVLPASLRVHRDALLAVDAAQVALELPLEAAPADVVAGHVRRLPRGGVRRVLALAPLVLALLQILVEPLQLVRARLVHVPDEVAAEPGVPVVPVWGRDDVDAEQVHLVREVQVERVAPHVDLHDERLEAVEALRVARRPLHLGAGTLDLLLGQRHHRREAREHLVALLAAEVRRERHVVRGARVHEDAVVPVEDEAAVGRLPQLLDVVVVRLLLVLVAPEDLELVQATDEHEEGRDEDAGRPEEAGPEVLLRRTGRAGRDEGHR